MDDHAFTSEFLGLVQKTYKRKQCKKACAGCKKAHAACTNQRPCHRCSVRGLDCVDPPRKRRKNADDGASPPPKRMRASPEREDKNAPEPPHEPERGEGVDFGLSPYDSDIFLKEALSGQPSDEILLEELESIFSSELAEQPVDDGAWLNYLSDEVLASTDTAEQQAYVVEDHDRAPVQLRPPGRVDKTLFGSYEGQLPANDSLAWSPMNFVSGNGKIDIFKTNLFDRTVDGLASLC